MTGVLGACLLVIAGIWWAGLSLAEGMSDAPMDIPPKPRLMWWMLAIGGMLFSLWLGDQIRVAVSN